MTEIKTNWVSNKIDTQAAFPQKLEIASSFLLEENSGRDGFFHIADNLLGILGYYSEGLDVFDTEKGKVLWRVKWIDMLGGHALYDNGILYVGYQASNTPAKIKAHKIETGEVIWECKLTNSREQFGTHMVQTSNHIIAPNVMKDTLFIIDKQTGRQTAKLPMTNDFEGGRGAIFEEDVVFTHNEKLYILAYKKNYILDCYNPETTEFESTLFEFPLSETRQEIQERIQIDGDLCLFMRTGEFYRISLADGKVKAQLQLGIKENPDDYFRTLSGFLHYQNKLSLVVRDRKDENTLYTYNLETDKLEESVVIPQLDKDYSIIAPTPYANTVLRYGFGEPSKNGLALYNFENNETLSELILPQYSEVEVDDDGDVEGTDWRENHIIIGDAIYLIQKIDENCILHRIQ